MEATQRLITEHKEILLALDILGGACNALSNDVVSVSQDLERLHEFLITFADKNHHKKEENILFRAMSDAGMPLEEGPLAVMLVEHEEGRSYIKGMGEALSQINNQAHKRCELFIGYARSYVQLLSQHIDKEDNILYPMADNFISPTEDCRILDEFALVENEILGNKKETYRLLLQNLKTKYV